MSLNNNGLNNIISTIVLIPSTDSEYSIPGEMTVDQVRASYASQIPGLSNMEGTAREESRNGGNVRIITFKPRTGTKGSDVARTVVLVPSTDSEYAIPGDMTPSQIIASYASQIPGLSNMSHEERYENQTGIGRVRIVTFKPRTGTKG